MAVKRHSRRRFLLTAGAGAFGVAASAIVVACGGPAATPTSAPKAESKPATGGAAATPAAAGAATPAAAGAAAPAAAGAATKPAASAGATAPAAKPAAGAGAPTTLTFAHYLDPAAAKVYESITQTEWKQKFPNVDVKIDISPEADYTGKMLTQMGGGNFTDVLMVTDRYVPDFASRDVLVDMNANVKRDDAQFDIKDLNEDLIQSGTWDGKLVSIFDYTGPIVVYYNKRLFKEAGVEPPKDSGASWTYDDFTETIKKLTRGEAEKRVWGAEAYGPAFCWQSYVVQCMGGKLTGHRGPAPAEKVTFNYTSPEVKKAVQMQSDWVLKDKSNPQPGAVQGDPFQAQRVAMKVVAGRWLAPLYNSFSWVEDLGMLHQPNGAVPRQSRNGPRGLMIPKGSKNQDQAWEFVKFITDKNGMQLLFRLNYSTPARKSLWDPFAKTLPKWEDVEIYRTSQKAMSELGALPTYPKFAKANKIMTDNLNAHWLGQMDLDTALKKVETELNAEMKAPT
jgi:multiple sugar transport system substrate-binding protein